MTTQLVRSTTNQESILPDTVRIQKILWETDDVFSLTLDMSQWKDHQGFRFTTGQFNMVYAYGMGEAAISISSTPEQTEILTHTIHRVGIVTTALSQLHRGDNIGIRGPFGTGWPLDTLKGRDVLIVAGGIGLAPLRPVIYHVLRHRSEFGRLILLYGARTPRNLLFRVELEQWSKLPNVEVLVTVDKGDSSWKGNISVVTKLLGSVKLDLENTIVLVCGPELMMKYGAEDIERYGITPAQIYLSMERNMRCGAGLCGHCQFGPLFICKDGPVFPYERVRHLLAIKEL
jgi:NAD(P)H-flavin reductase